MKYGDVCSQKLQENSKWKMIIDAVPPVFDVEYAKNHSQFVKTLITIIQKIIKTADEAKLHSIAIPLLGTGRDPYKTPVETCASSFYKAVMANKSELMYLNDIYLVLKEEEQEKMYLEDFALINCKITQRPVTHNGKSDDFGKAMNEKHKEGENCCICMDTPTKPKKLRKCGHIFCKECIEQYFEYKPVCPSCDTIYGKVTGDQPPGTMSIRTNGIRLQGFNDSRGSIVLTYFFNDGKQGEEHPDPGKVYKGFSRSGYLPFNKKGRLIAKLLNVAFSRRLVFTIGRSRTTGHDGVITWNDIYHKTRMEGGPARFGYPDPTYLDRVLEELEAKGVTEETADDPEEYKEYSREIGY
eukprot:XP_011416745.2 PREDICTED: E3 ubiquitin-protein ligase DTX3L-like [Crassostrea gigas]